MNNLTKTENVLLSLVSNALFQSSVNIPLDVDWQAVAKEANAQSVFSLAFHNFELFPIEIQCAVKRQFKLNISNNVNVNWNHARLNEMMSKANIHYVILKGCASAYYYPEPIYRTMGDVDFLVPKNDLERADSILKQEGFVPWNENHICHIVYKKSGSHLEMHFEPAGVPSGKTGEIIRSYLDDIFEKAIEIDTADGKMIIPSHFHHGLILLLHTCHHLTGEGVGLRHLCDWAVFANHLSNDEFREIFEEKLKAVGLWRFAQLLTQLSSKYLGMPEKEWAMDNVDDELLNAMIHDIFDGGNFGKKDNQRINESYLISSRGKHGVKNTSMFRQLIISLNEATYVHIPLIKKLKFLLPFGCIYMLLRQLIYIACGKRNKVNVSKMISGANERKEIYKQFNLFEI
jgi:hypothetical protein